MTELHTHIQNIIRILRLDDPKFHSKSMIEGITVLQHASFEAQAAILGIMVTGILASYRDHGLDIRTKLEIDDDADLIALRSAMQAFLEIN